MKESKLRGSYRQLRHALRHKRLVTAVYLALRLLVILIMIAQCFNRNFENVFLCLLTLVLFTLPTTLERKLNIDLPDTLEIIILLFIFAAEILGEIQSFYTTFPYWDTILHTLNGFLCAAIGFCLVDLFDRSERFSLTLSPAFMAIVAFCFSMTVGVLWEFFEFFMDKVFLFDMQKDTVIPIISSVTLDPAKANNAVVIGPIVGATVQTPAGSIPLELGGYLDIGLVDTMLDLIVNFIGAVIFSLIGFFYVKHRGRGRFARPFIPRILPEDDATMYNSRPAGHTDTITCMEVSEMTCNNNIKCTVSTCVHHSKESNCCSLSQIQVGCTAASPTDCRGTECVSFSMHKN